MHDASCVVYSCVSPRFHMMYITRMIPTFVGFMHVPDTYFPVLLARESILVMQFYKNNATSAVVARNPV